MKSTTRSTGAGAFSRTAAVACAAALLAPAAARAVDAAIPPPAPPARISFGITTDVLWRTDRGYDLFSDGSSDVAMGLAAGYDLLRVPPRVVIAVGGGWRREKAEAPLATSADARLSGDSFYATASAQWELRPWLEPQLVVMLGATHAVATIDPSQERVLSDDAWGAIGSLGAGITLRTPRGSLRSALGAPTRYGLSFLMEGGYALSTPLSFSVRPTLLPSDALPTRDVPLGDVFLSGPYLRFAARVHF